mmetsp:Transcript_90723/g.216579  ORF Transcript_90723/g.216579 Transcript_90723/m.216579 type:complete len:215 (-) Transcript_90723:4782-5426(-)
MAKSCPALANYLGRCSKCPARCPGKCRWVSPCLLVWAPMCLGFCCPACQEALRSPPAAAARGQRFNRAACGIRRRQRSLRSAAARRRHSCRPAIPFRRPGSRGVRARLHRSPWRFPWERVLRACLPVAPTWMGSWSSAWTPRSRYRTSQPCSSCWRVTWTSSAGRTCSCAQPCASGSTRAAMGLGTEAGAKRVRRMARIAAMNGPACSRFQARS